MTKLNRKSFGVDGVYIPQYNKPQKIGGIDALIKYLDEKLGITTPEELEEAMNDCLVIERQGKIYYNCSRC